jgi:VanZ family protein
MGLIFCLSSIPHLGIEGLGEIENQVSRKSIHIIVYGILALLMWHSFPGLDNNLFKKLVLCGFLAILFAISDEIRQGFIPGRSGNARGVFFDSIGIAVAIAWLGIRTPVLSAGATGQELRSPEK